MAAKASDPTQEEIFLKQWEEQNHVEVGARSVPATQEEEGEKFAKAMSMLDNLLAASSEYHRRMAAIQQDVIKAQEPVHFDGTLRDYQLEGFQWLIARFLFGEGAILVRQHFPHSTGTTHLRSYFAGRRNGTRQNGSNNCFTCMA